MNRLIALSIIPLLALGTVFPHSHGNQYVESDHADRPHLHTGHSHHEHGDHHHAHSEESNAEDESSQERETPVDHDSDAVYLGGGPLFLHHVLDIRIDAAPASFENLAVTGALALGDLEHAITGHSAPIHDGPPLFLLHAALRL